MTYQIIEFYSNSFEELAFQVDSWNLTVYQLAPGKLSGRSYGIRLPGIDIGMRQSSLPMAQVGSVPGNSWTLTFPDHDDGVIVGGCRGADNIQLSSTDGMRHYTRPATVYALSIQNDLLQDLCTTRDIAEVIQSLNGCVEVAPEKKLHLKQLLVHTIEAFQKTATISNATSCALKNALSDACRDYLAHILSHNPGITKTTKSACTDRKEKILASTLQSIHGQNIGRISLQATIKDACTTPRNLQYVFKDSLLMSPKKYLMCLRLSAIRLALLDQNTSLVPIGSLINQYGIANEGRFSHQYFEFFGELPKTTRTRYLLPD